MECLNGGSVGVKVYSLQESNAVQLIRELDRKQAQSQKSQIMLVQGQMAAGKRIGDDSPHTMIDYSNQLKSLKYKESKTLLEQAKESDFGVLQLLE